ncbi:unnamed protein product [Aureobasidium mustum]|uniref:CCD97-like C-terminal domain-containing protein n=1 Tax=Aureobasidium mustum TaxID=2773714 RepID=A0A9N8JEQ6_9PEZI|nr:unnamed protein product [Aureobasidium mustum]
MGKRSPPKAAALRRCERNASDHKTSTPPLYVATSPPECTLTMPHFPSADQASDGQESEVARTARIRVKTRRRRYLEQHGEYFESPSLELAGAAAWHVRFQSAAEREADGRDKGYSGILEADLMRSEAKIEALNHPDPNSPLVYRRDASGAITTVEQDEEDRPKTKEEGLAKWREYVEMRFLRGEDQDFDYGLVDEDEHYDDLDWQRQEREESYFGHEEAEFVGEGEKKGETGIQDY